jgi:hydrogenase-4 component F
MGITLFLIYIFGGVFLTAIVLANYWRRYRSHHSILLSNDFLNSFTLIHIGIYLILTLYVIFRVQLPIYAFNQYLGMDPLSIYEVLISTVVFLLAAIYGRGYIKSLITRREVSPESLGLYYGAFNLLLASITFSFFSNNLALFWIFLELTTILSAVLIVMLSAKENITAALKYVFIASTAMLFSVVGLIILFAMSRQTLGTGTLNWNELMAGAKSLSPSLMVFAFTFIFIGFASKAGIVPFHTWLPQSHAKAPAMVSAVLSAVLLNGGIYGIIRLSAVAHQTESWHTVAIIMIVFGVLSIAISALSMLPRSNIKKLIGFSSIEHMGMVLIGTAIGTPVVLFWVLFHILAHSMIKSLLFFSAGILNHQYNSNKIQDIQNALKLQPLASWGIIIGSVAVIGMPPFPMFFSKLFILVQIGSFSWPLLFLILILLLIVSAAFTFLLIRAFSQTTDSPVKPYFAHWTMKAPILLLFIIIIGTSVYLATGLNPLLTNITASLGF